MMISMIRCNSPKLLARRRRQRVDDDDDDGAKPTCFPVVGWLVEKKRLVRIVIKIGGYQSAE